MGLAGEAVAAERSLAKQKGSAEAQLHALSTGMSATAFQVGLPHLLPADSMLLQSLMSQNPP